MVEIFDFLSRHPFLFGLATGLVISIAVWVKGLLKNRALHKEIASLKESLYTKMQIEAKGHMNRETELEQLRQQNENLRVTVKSLQQKAGRNEIRQLHVYDKAIHSMLANAPGFAPTWEMVVKQAEEEIRETETGIGAFVRKVFVPRKSLPKDETTPEMIDYEEDKDSE